MSTRLVVDTGTSLPTPPPAAPFPSHSFLPHSCHHHLLPTSSSPLPHPCRPSVLSLTYARPFQPPPLRALINLEIIWWINLEVAFYGFSSSAPFITRCARLFQPPPLLFLSLLPYNYYCYYYYYYYYYYYIPSASSAPILMLAPLPPLSLPSIPVPPPSLA